ncbi:MAG: DNA cytosine methyltransferase, partial [Deltaproteobacteria bacterium]|nr:DNA cytosine methyltransferase [Deltaproteobacteria bacterium]
MRELSLFSGAGGGLLGTYLLGFSPVGYVEFSDYCQRVLKQRIKDGVFPEAPIFGDIKAFIGEGYAESYTGMVDVITAGFPCQEFSVAGARAGSSGERNMWPETWTAIRTIRPRAVFLENVPGLLTSGVEADPDIDISYFGSILADLAEIGYSEIRYCILGADDVGAPHRRKRLWILGY